MFERFSDEARAAVVAAREEATGLRHGYIGTEHLLLGLLRDPATRAAKVLGELAVAPDAVRAEVERLVGRGEADLDADALATLGIDLDAVRERVEHTFGPGALSGRRRRGCLDRSLPMTRRAKKTLELSLREAIAMGDRDIGAEHVLLGLAREGDGVAGRILRSRGVDADRIRAALGRLQAA